MREKIRNIMLELANEGSFFRLLDEDEIRRVSSYFDIFEFPAGTTLSPPGEPLDMLGIIISGEVWLEEEMELKGHWIVLARMTRGAILAHPSLFGVEPPPIRVVVQKDTSFLGIDGQTFERFLEGNKEIGIKFLKEMIRVMFIRFRGLAGRFTDVF